MIKKLFVFFVDQFWRLRHMVTPVNRVNISCNAIEWTYSCGVSGCS